MRLYLAFLMTFACTPAAIAEVIETPGINYHLELPKNYDPAKTYRLVVMVHGTATSGTMASGEAKVFAARGLDVVVAGPNFSFGNGPGKEKAKDEKAGMDAMLKDLRAKHKLHDKFVLIGASAGSLVLNNWGPSHEDQLLMMAYYISGVPRYAPKSLPLVATCGAMEASSTALKAWGEKFNASGGYALVLVAEGVGHQVTDSMRNLTVDLYEKCSQGLAPRVFDEIQAKFEEAKKLEDAQKYKEATARYKSVLATKGLPDNLKEKALEGQVKVVLAEMSKANPEIAQTWADSRKAVLAALQEPLPTLEFRKLLEERRRPFRGKLELDGFFTQADTASQLIIQINEHLKVVETATAKGGKGPSQILLNRRISPLVAKIDDPEIRVALDAHLAKLPQPVGK